MIRLKEWRRGPAKRPKKAYLDIKVTPHDEEKAIEGIFEFSNIGGAVWENVLCRRTDKKSSEMSENLLSCRTISVPQRDGEKREKESH